MDYKKALKSKYQEQGFQILAINETENSYHVTLRDKSTATVTCPVCGTENTTWGYTELRTYQDVPVNGKPVILHVSRRDVNCSCGKHFTAPHAHLPSKHYAGSMVDMMRAMKCFDDVSMKKVAAVLGVSEATVRRM